MKNRHSQKQKGSSLEIIIIVVLVVAIIGLLGFVFWNNFVNKSDDNTAQKSNETTNAVDNTKKTLTIPEWGVKGNYTAKADLPISYIIKQAGEDGDKYDYIVIYTPTLPEDCRGLGYGTAIVRYVPTNKVHYVVGSERTAGDIPPSALNGLGFNKINNHIYQWPGAQSTCSTKTDSIQTYVISVTTEIMGSLALID